MQSPCTSSYLPNNNYYCVPYNIDCIIPRANNYDSYTLDYCSHCNPDDNCWHFPFYCIQTDSQDYNGYYYCYEFCGTERLPNTDFDFYCCYCS